MNLLGEDLTGINKLYNEEIYSQPSSDQPKNSVSEKVIAIIGAGIAGLTLCLELCRLGIKPILLERQKFCGGLATSIPYGDYKIDIGPHYVALPKHSEITEDIFNLMGQNEVIKLPDDIFSKFYKTNFNGKLYSGYPSLKEVIRNSGSSFFIKSIWSIFLTKLKNKSKKSEFNNAKDYLCSSYGEFLYDAWFKPYLYRRYQDNEPPISDVLKQFPVPTFQRIFSNAIEQSKKTSSKDVSYSEKDAIICYFNGGMLSLIKKIENEILKLGGRIEIDFDIHSVEHLNSKKTIIGNKNGKKITFQADGIVYATNPQIALQWFENIPNSLILKNDNNGIHIIMVFLFIDKPKLFDSWVINFYDQNICFSRIAQQNFLSETIAPPGKSLLSIEIRTTENNPLWKMSDSQLYKLVVHDLESSKILSKEKIDDYKIIKFKNLFPNPLLKKQNSREKIIEFINSHQNEYAIAGEIDTGVLATGTSEKSPQKILYGGGIYMSFYKSKNLAEVISSALK